MRSNLKIKMKKLYIINIGIGIILALTSLVLIKNQQELRNFVLSMILIFTSLPIVLFNTRNLAKQKEKDEKFLEFVRDVLESVRSGTPISKSIVNLKNRDYGALSENVKKMANQVSIGITLTEAFETFSKETHSPVIARSINLISEANKSGGEITSILGSVASSVNQIEIIKKERRSAIANLVVQGYIIFFVFILIMLILEFFLMPLIEGIGPVQNLNVEIKPSEGINSQANFLLLLVQSFFCGLVIGKISEGKISAGFKHSFILLSIALITSSIARFFFG